jgi:hypothetical protein
MNQKSERKEPKSLMNQKQVVQTKLLITASGLFDFCCGMLLLLNRKTLDYGWKFALMMGIVLVMLGMYYLIRHRLERYFAIRKFYWWLLGFRTTMAVTLLLLVLAMRPVVYQIAN